MGCEVTDIILQETFQSQYSSVKGAKVLIDANTTCTKGYGFVRFGGENKKNRAMIEMNGVYCSSKPMRINEATPKKSLGFQQPDSMKGMLFKDGRLYLYFFISSFMHILIGHFTYVL